MYEYTIINRQTNEMDIIFGYSSADAFRRAHLSPLDWEVHGCVYAD